MEKRLKVYIIGSLRNEEIPSLGNALRRIGITAFDDWHGAGPEADDFWKSYEVSRGRGYEEALYGEAARNTFDFDKRHLDECDAGVLVMPAGKSAHMEIGYLVGKGKRAYILFDGYPERWDVMYLFATRVFFTEAALVAELKEVAEHADASDT